MSSRIGRTAALRLAAIVAVALTAAACGGSSGVTAAAYVKSMCTALGSWKTDVENAGLKLQSSGAATASRPAARDDYRTFISSLVDATRRAASSLHAAGEPNVTGGKPVANALSGAFDRASTKLAQAETQAAAIPTSSASAFQLGASSVTAEIRSALEVIGTAAPSKSPALRAAAAKDPACRVLRTSTTG